MASTTPPAPQPQAQWRRLLGYIFDIRVIGVLAQIAFVVVAILVIGWFLGNTAENITKLGESQFICRDGSSSLRCAFDFLRTDAQYDISESPIPYTPADSYWRALGVGALNSLKVISLGIVLTTVLGTLVGIARLSSNWLVSNVARWYVDFFRNTPLVLQLVFIFFVFFAVLLPTLDEASQLFGLPIFLSRRGVNYPSLVFMSAAGVWIAFVILGIIQAQVLWVILGRREEMTGAESNRLTWAILSFLAVAGIGWVFASNTTSSQAILVPNSARVREFADLKGYVLNQLNVSNLGDIPIALESGQITEEQLAAATVKVCVVRDSRSEVNLTAQLRRASIPYEVNRESRADRAVEAYAAGECTVYVADKAQLAADRDILENGASHTIVDIPEAPVRVSIPQREGLNFQGGGKMTPQFAAVLLGLVLNTGANVAEIVRAGIQSVSKGQTEAARALGLSEGQRLRLVVLPQALQVIIPPQTSQYLNLAKNSTLALAVAYPDFWNIANTTINQSGRAIQIMVLVMASYLALSLLISAFLNWYNARVKIKER